MRKEMKRLKKEAPWLFSGSGSKNRKLMAGYSDAKDLQAVDAADTSVVAGPANNVGQAGGPSG